MLKLYSVQLIKPEQTLHLRQKILRPFSTEAECVYPGDNAEPNFHLGAISDKKIVCVASFYLEKATMPALQYAKKPFRLRGMATDTAYVKKGYGRDVLQQGINLLRQQRCDLLWCNARENAFQFYQRLGFSFEGDFFDLPKIGPHKVMYITL
jgi:predicted GNAT family N-acyltransferase